MLIPIGDRPGPKGIPWMTCLLILVNVYVYAGITYPLSSAPFDPRAPGAGEYLTFLEGLTKAPRAEIVPHLSQYDLFIFRTGGLRPAHPTLLALFFSMFLHAGVGHLFGNMLYLWIFGDNVEHRMGILRFLLAYLATGVCAALPMFVLRAGSDLPMLGASGAISGVLGLYFIWFPHHMVRVMVWLGRPWFFELEAWWVLVFYLIVDNLVPFFLAGDALGVAHSAHLGGFVGGLLMAKAIDSRTRRRDPEPSRPFVPMQRKYNEPEPPLAPVRKALEAGSAEEAFRLYAQLPPALRAGITEPELMRLGDWLEESSQYGVALAIYEGYLDTADSPELRLRAGILLADHLGRPAEAREQLQQAARTGGRKLAARAAEVLARVRC